MTELNDNKNRRILIVDDNRAIHEDFRKILSPVTSTAAALDVTEAELFGEPANAVQKIQYEIDSAYQGQDGVMLVQKALEAGRPYAMAFVDIRMPPGIDGVETTQGIWKIDPEVQIVLCTAYADYSWDEMFEKIGNSDGLVILKKPFDTVEALQLAHALTEKWWLHQQSKRKMEELEGMVAARTGELAKSLSLLTATFDSMADGIVAVDLSGKVISYNSKFTAIWQFPAELLARRDAAEWRAHTAGLVKDPAGFLQRISELKANPPAEVFDVIELKDGRTFERFIFPQRLNGARVGEVVSWRDITERKRAAAELQLKTAFLEAQVNSSIDGILVVDPQGKKTLQNQRLADLFKIPQPIADDKDDEPQRRWVAGVTKDPEQFLARIAHLNSRPDEISRDEIELKDGTMLDRYSAPVIGHDGKYYGRIWTFRDITERKRSENILRESEERFSSAFDLAPIGMALVAPDGRWLKVNRAICAIVGYSEAELLARTFQEITHPDDLAADLECMRRLLAGEIHFYEMEKRYIHARGHFVSILLNVSLVCDVQQQPLYFIAQIQDITERKQAEEAQARLVAILEATPDFVSMADPEGRVIYTNRAGRALVGLAEREDVSQYNVRQFHDAANNQIIFNEAIPTAMRTGVWSGETELLTLDGHLIPVLQVILIHKGPDGAVTFSSTVARDITERKRLEAQLIQSQKLETVGKLAGGIAHEFNSILTAIIGQSELLLEDLPVGSPLITNVTEISRAAGRAATLTRQLLAYGRKQFLQPEILDLNRVIASMAGVFQHLMGTDVDTQIDPAPDLRAVKADAGQIEQVIMNMVINARDAMPNGGKLTLETSNITFDRDSVGRYAELKPGDYVMLAITDTGTGMSEAIKARLFEPFFSTKGVGQGTGLGLSTCYGIIKQSGGHISAYSEVGRGTTFKIFLPQVEAQTKISTQRLAAPGLPNGTETILLVEDDPALREMAAALLRRLGYAVFTAANGVEALSVQHERSTGHVDLLFTDVVMPHMSGKELADRVRALYPDTKILFTSAYTENAIVQQGVLNKGVALLQKPFTPSALAHKLREVLDQPGALKPDPAQKTFGFTNPSGLEATPENKS